MPLLENNISKIDIIRYKRITVMNRSGIYQMSLIGHIQQAEEVRLQRYISNGNLLLHPMTSFSFISIKSSWPLCPKLTRTLLTMAIKDISGILVHHIPQGWGAPHFSQEMAA